MVPDIASRTEPITPDFLESFSDAWNSHDVEAIIEMMTADCLYQSSIGSEAEGKSYLGHANVREAVEEVFRLFPDASWSRPKHFIAGDRGVSEWLFSGTGPNGKVEVYGCDLFTFRDGKIAIKNSFRKQRS